MLQTCQNNVICCVRPVKTRLPFTSYSDQQKMASYAGSAEERSTFASDSSKKESDNEQNSNFECNICLDVARDAVVSLCGHLFW